MCPKRQNNPEVNTSEVQYILNTIYLHIRKENNQKTKAESQYLDCYFLLLFRNSMKCQRRQYYVLHRQQGLKGTEYRPPAERTLGRDVGEQTKDKDHNGRDLTVDLPLSVRHGAKKVHLIIKTISKQELAQSSTKEK